MTNRRAVVGVGRRSAIVVFIPGTSTATLLAVARLPLSSISEARAGSNARICRSTRRPLPAGSSISASRPAVERDPALRTLVVVAAFVDDRLRDVDAVGGDPHVPRHAVGVADLLGELVDEPLPLIGCHRRDLARRCGPGRSSTSRRRHRTPAPATPRRVRSGFSSAHASGFSASTMSLAQSVSAHRVGPAACVRFARRAPRPSRARSRRSARPGKRAMTGDSAASRSTSGRTHLGGTVACRDGRGDQAPRANAPSAAIVAS